MVKQIFGKTVLVTALVRGLQRNTANRRSIYVFMHVKEDWMGHWFMRLWRLGNPLSTMYNLKNNEIWWCDPCHV